MVCCPFCSPAFPLCLSPPAAHCAEQWRGAATGKEGILKQAREDTGGAETQCLIGSFAVLLSSLRPASPHGQSLGEKSRPPWLFFEGRRSVHSALHRAPHVPDHACVCASFVYPYPSFFPASCASPVGGRTSHSSRAESCAGQSRKGKQRKERRGLNKAGRKQSSQVACLF